MSGLSLELIFLILQLLNEENYKEAAHRLESESGVYCNVDYIEELVVKGDWDKLEKYLAGFIRVGDNRFSVKMLFEIRKQKYLEALDKKERAKALDILKEELKVFKQFDGELFSEMTNLLTIENIRENAQLSTYTDDVTARGVLAKKLKKLIEMNPELHHKCRLPTMNNSRLCLLVNQSLKWQHQLCQNPNSDPDITSILVDHTCGPQNAAQGLVPMANEFSSILRSGGLPLQPEVPIYLGTSSRAQGTLNSLPLTLLPNSGGGPILAAHNNGENQLVLRRSRSFDLSNEIRNIPTSSVTRPGQINADNFFASEDLPKNVISTINVGSDVTSMDFHPEHETLLLVGTNNGEISIWDIGSRLRIAYRMFIIWDFSTCSSALQASYSNEHLNSVTRVMWSPDGLFLGVAYSKHILQLYSYRTGHELRDHLEIEAHVGNVNDLAFFNRDHRLYIITCGQDKLVKIWDVVTGVNQRTLEGHDAPVYSFLYTTAIDGKIKVWSFDNLDIKFEYDSPGYTSIRMAYSTDGLSRNLESYLVEWDEGEGNFKQNYLGLGKHCSGVVKFDTTNRFLVAADDFTIKFWNMENTQVLYRTDADGGLPAFPCIRFSKNGSFLVVSTNDNGIKILGNQEGYRIVKNTQNQSEGRRVASGSVSKPPTFNIASSLAPGAILALPASTSRTNMASQNKDRQNLQDAQSRNNIDELEFSIIWRLKEVTESSHLRSLKLPDNLLPVRIVRLIYKKPGSALLALAYNGVHKLWKWQQADKRTPRDATADVEPQLWQPSSGILMTNDVEDASMDDTVHCLTLSNNSAYVISASGGKASLYNLQKFTTLATFQKPAPAATCLVFNPRDNNFIVIGLSDCSIQVVKTLSNGHQKCVTGLAFFPDKKILVSAGADAQLCVWSMANWEKLTSKFLKLPSGHTSNAQAETRLHINVDQSRLLVVHETHIATYDPLKLDCILQWVPQQTSGSITDAVYSCDGQSIFVSAEDGSVCVLTANQLRLKCKIHYTAYVPSNRSTIKVCPNAIAAHPSNPSQLALGLSDGGVYVLEPLESDKEWGSDPLSETGAGSSSNHVVAN
ncbi:topless-related protein 4 [Artemisia annua]|uniref:Topless-related protein 4 n=1 Tax=Artemisia annua TaxID=35608 RepID=A0A2U1L1E9_ARTAN|nr:topless-related protein 4 [Artemisia annua]